MAALLQIAVCLCLSSATKCAMPSKSEWCVRLPGYDFPKVSTIEDCCAACASDDKCKSWTFAEKVAVTGPTSRCHLKNVTDAGESCKGSSSGSKAPFPAPTPGPNPKKPTPAPQPTPAPPPAPAGAMNVLFIMVDDLRPEFNKAYHQTRLVTPNLDEFVDTSLVFDRAYVQYSHCSPSRNSVSFGFSRSVGFSHLACVRFCAVLEWPLPTVHRCL
jgi:hypothetical protein